jgi:autotransporter-associated beta strand protein
MQAACVPLLHALPASAITRSWTHSNSQYWSDPNNWSPSGIPQPGDDLLFYDEVNLSGPDPMINDLVGLSVRSLDFNVWDRSGLVTPDWVLNGNTLTLTGPIATDPASDEEHVYINCALIIGTDLHVVIQTGNSDSSEIHLTGAIDLNGQVLSLYNFQFGVLEVSGVISGSGNVIAVAADGYASDFMTPIVISGTQGNTFDGTFTVTVGIFGNLLPKFGHVLLNKQSGVAVPGRLIIEQGATVVLGHSEQIADDANVTIAGNLRLYSQQFKPSLLLNGYYETVGSLYLTNLVGDTNAIVVDTGGGTLTLNGSIFSHSDSDQAAPVIKGRLNLANGNHNLLVAGSGYAGLDLQAQLLGSGGFTKAGNDALLLETNNTFTGAVVVNQGILEARNNGALGAAGGSTTLSGSGSLTLRNANIAGKTLFSEGNQPITPETVGSLLLTVGSCSWSGPIQLDQNLVVYADNTTLNGPISGVGGLDVRNGTAILGGTLGNLYTGTTLVRCALLGFAKPSGVNAYAGPLVVGGGAGGPYEARWLQSYQNVGATATLYANGLININGFTEDFGPVTFNGGEVDTGTGTFNIYAPVTVNASPSSAVINGNLGLPPGDNRVFIVGDGASDCDLLVNAVVFGSPGLYVVKQGAGTMCLANFNTFNAPMLLEQGILDINNGQSLGTWPGLVIFDGATLRVSGSGNGGGFEAIGAGVGGTHGAIEVLSNASFTFAGGMLLDGPTTFNVGTSGGLALNAPISSSGPNCSVIKNGPGTMSFGGTTANTYSGDTIINAGQCWLGKSAYVVAVPGNLVIGPGPTGPTTSVHWLQAGGLVGPLVTVNVNSVLDLNGYNQSLSQLRLNDGGSVMTGVGTLTLPNGALVQVGSLDPLRGSLATSTINGFIGLPTLGNITFSVNPFLLTFTRGPELDVGAAISGAINHGATATLFKEGLGQMRLSGNSTFSGNFFINGGKVIAASANALGGTFRGTIVNNDASLVLDGGINIAAEYLTLNSSNAAALENLSGNNIWGGEIYLNRDSTINVIGADSLIASGLIDGPGALVKVGSGNLLLAGNVNNTYVGETFVNQGTLLLDKPTAVTAIPGAVEIGAVDDSTAGTVRNLTSYQIVGNIYVHSRGLYDVNGQEENTDALVMYGNGDVETGAGYVSLKTGAPIFVYPGTNTTSTINGTLMLDPGNHILNVGSGATTSGVQDLVINAVIGETSSGGALQKEGAGRMRLAANNSYTGATTVNAGTLQVDGSQGQSAVTINSGTLQGSGTVGAVSLTSASATVSPGASPGILSSGSFGGGSGTVRIELNGTTPGTGYDQLNVSGSVNLSGMSLNASLGYASSTNDQFTIIANDATDPVTGTFSGLQQGKKLYIGQQLFQISYNGGSGNDVVLSRLITPPPPTLTIQKVPPASVRLLWPTNDPPFSLQTASSLLETNWSAALPLPVVTGTNNVVTNLISDSQQFYRLSSP